MKTLRLRLGMIAGMLAVSLAATCWMFFRPPEDPLCKGMRLSEWLDSADGDFHVSPIQKEDLRAIGPKAAPFLAYYLRCNDPNGEIGILQKMRLWLQSALPPSMRNPDSLDPRMSQIRFFVACQALFWLGRDAEPALPTLLRMVEDPKNTQASECAKVIHGMGAASWPTVLKILHDGSFSARRSIISQLPSRLEGSPPPVTSQADKKLTVELLLEACLDPDPAIQVTALRSLVQCWRSPYGSLPLLDPAIPVIIRCMEEGTKNVPEVAADISTYFPQHAETIIPALEKLAGSSNPDYRLAASEALRNIRKQKPGGR